MDGFHVQEDLLDVLFVFPVFHSRFSIDIGLVTNGDELSKTQIQILQNIQDTTAQCTGLGHETDIATFGQCFGKATVHTNRGMGIDHAQAVRTHATHTVSANLFKQGLFCSQTFRPRFLETGRNDYQTLDALFVALINRLQHKLAIDHNDGQIDLTRNVQNRRVSLQAFNHATLRINGINRTGKTVLLESLHDVGADRVGLRRSANHCDRAGLHDVI